MTHTQAFNTISWRHPSTAQEKGGAQTGTGSKIQLIHDRREGLENPQRHSAEKPQEIGNNTPLPFDPSLCVRKMVSGYVWTALILDQGQVMFLYTELSATVEL